MDIYQSMDSNLWIRYLSMENTGYHEALMDKDRLSSKLKFAISEDKQALLEIMHAETLVALGVIRHRCDDLQSNHQEAPAYRERLTVDYADLEEQHAVTQRDYELLQKLAAKDHELSSAFARVDALESEDAAKIQKIEQAQAKVVTCQREHQQVLGSLDNSKVKVVSRIYDLTTEVALKDALVEQLKTDLVVASETIKGNEVMVESLSNDCAKLQVLLAQKDARNEKNEASIEQQDLQLDDLEEDIDEKNGKIADLEGKLRSKNTTIAKLEAEKSSVKDAAFKLKSPQKQMIHELQAQIDALEQTTVALENESANNSTVVHNLQVKVNALERTTITLKDESAKKDFKIITLQTLYATASDTLRKLEIGNETKTSCLDTMKNLIIEKDKALEESKDKRRESHAANIRHERTLAARDKAIVDLQVGTKQNEEHLKNLQNEIHTKNKSTKKLCADLKHLSETCTSKNKVIEQLTVEIATKNAAIEEMEAKLSAEEDREWDVVAQDDLVGEMTPTME